MSLRLTGGGVLYREFSSKELRTVGNYSIGRLIGKGSFGKVYLATHKLTNGSKVYILTLFIIQASFYGYAGWGSRRVAGACWKWPTGIGDGGGILARVMVMKVIDVDEFGVVGCIEVGSEGRREPGERNTPSPTTDTSTYRTAV